MGTISTGIGLLSGLQTADIIDQLIAIESRPLKQVQSRIEKTQAQRAALLALNAGLLAVRNAASGFDQRSFFRTTAAKSGNSDVLTAATTEGAQPGVHTFQVHSLVTRQQLISKGFATKDQTPIGQGMLSFDSAQARVAARMPLGLLNNQQGISGGRIRITDRSGATADVDLTTATSLDEIVDAISTQTAVNVRASVSGDRIVLFDQTGQSVTNFTVQDLAGGRLAQSLGIAKSTNQAVLTGADINNLTSETQLTLLNDQNGVRREILADFRISLSDGGAGIDVDLSPNLTAKTNLGVLNSGNGVRLGIIRITDRSGASVDVDLTGLNTVGEIQDKINNDATAAGVAANAIFTGNHFLVSESSGAKDQNFIIEDVSGSAALDLGIAADVEATAISGSGIYRIDTVGDVLRAINLHADNPSGSRVQASISADGNGLVLTDLSTPGEGTFAVSALNNSKAAQDLGLLSGASIGNVLTGRQVLAGLGTVLLGSLNGGAGVAGGVVQITDRNGSVSLIDLSDADSLADVIDQINTVATLKAEINPAGNGILIRDTSGGTVSNLSVEDVTGSAAADLGIAQSVAAAAINGGNLQKKYISENSRLDDLNNGKGVERGRFRVINSNGAAVIIDLNQKNDVTLNDVIREINGRGLDVVASINTTGDGLLLTDNAGGTLALKVEEVDGGPIARSLGILGQAREGENFIDGSFETRVDIDADDTLDDVVFKLQEAGAPVTASIINDGGSYNPYRLTITSNHTGTQGELLFDPGDTALALSTLIEAKDAVVFLGSADSPNAVVITSSTNTLTDLVPGVTIDLVGTSDKPVELTISKDVQGIVESFATFAQSYNDALDLIDTVTAFDPETFERGLLLGDAAVVRVQDRLFRMMIDPIKGVPGNFDRLLNVGFSFGSGARLSFDEEKFREVFENDPEAVEALFLTSETGAGFVIEEELDRLTNQVDGLLTERANVLQDRVQLLTDRTADLQILIDARRARYEREFAALESALAGLQQQQNALSGFQIIPPATGSSRA
jgi:flagellar hook-associated protein 2